MTKIKLPFIIRRRGNMPETLLPIPPGFAELSKAEQVKYLQSL
jgi:hypothetical protein